MVSGILQMSCVCLELSKSWLHTSICLFIILFLSCFSPQSSRWVHWQFPQSWPSEQKFYDAVWSELLSCQNHPEGFGFDWARTWTWDSSRLFNTIMPLNHYILISPKQLDISTCPLIILIIILGSLKCQKCLQIENYVPAVSMIHCQGMPFLFYAWHVMWLKCTGT